MIILNIYGVVVIIHLKINHVLNVSKLLPLEPGFSASFFLLNSSSSISSLRKYCA